MLAGTERLDRQLMIGQMQGKFQLSVIPGVGHMLQEVRLSVWANARCWTEMTVTPGRPEETGRSPCGVLEEERARRSRRQESRGALSYVGRGGERRKGWKKHIYNVTVLSRQLSCLYT